MVLPSQASCTVTFVNYRSGYIILLLKHVKPIVLTLLSYPSSLSPPPSISFTPIPNYSSVQYSSHQPHMAIEHECKMRGAVSGKHTPISKA